MYILSLDAIDNSLQIKPIGKTSDFKTVLKDIYPNYRGDVTYLNEYTKLFLSKLNFLTTEKIVGTVHTFNYTSHSELNTFFNLNKDKYFLIHNIISHTILKSGRLDICYLEEKVNSPKLNRFIRGLIVNNILDTIP